MFLYFKNKLKAKLKSWRDTYKGYTCTQSPISDYCKKGICVKRKFGVLCGSKGSYPILTNLVKIDLDGNKIIAELSNADLLGSKAIRLKIGPIAYPLAVSYTHMTLPTKA